MILDETRYADLVGQHCRSPKCHAQVIWCDTQGNKQMLVDADPLPYKPGQDFGNVRLIEVAGRLQPLALVLKPAQLFGKQGTLHLSHFATCPDAQRFRKRGYER